MDDFQARAGYCKFEIPHLAAEVSRKGSGVSRWGITDHNAFADPPPSSTLSRYLEVCKLLFVWLREPPCQYWNVVDAVLSLTVNYRV